MGKKDLKNQNKELVVDIIDILWELDPSKTNKFLALLIKRFKEESSDFKKYIKSEIEHLMGLENLRALKDFNNHLENNRTTIKDVTQINNFGDLHEELVFVELNLKKKDLKKEIKVLYKDEEWLVLKPLSYDSSKVYGGGTKWCTSSREDDTQFYNYSNDGVLIYVIRLGTNEKFGIHWYFEKNKSVEMSWWDVEDRKVDSLTLNVPIKITQVVLNEFLETKNPNSHYFKGKDKERAQHLKNKRGGSVIPLYTHLDMVGPETLTAPDPPWAIENIGNITTTLGIDDAINKTLEYTYMAETMKKSLGGGDLELDD